MPTPVQLRDGLYKTLTGRRADIERLFAYHRGDHPLPWAPKEVRDAYLALMRLSRSNWCKLVPKAPAERLRAIGMRFSEEPTAGQPTDTQVWRRMWQANRMDLQSRKVHMTALVARRSFVLVWPRDGKPPRITPEHPSQVVVGYVPGDPYTRAAALKCFADQDAGREYATLWTPEAVYHWSRAWSAQGTNTTKLVSVTGSALQAEWLPWTDPALGILPEAPNPLGLVPVVEYQAEPEMVAEPMGELDGGVTDIQDRINRTICDRMVTSNFASFPQKWATGLEIPKDKDGNDKEPFKAAVNRIWTNENPDGKFGDFTVGDLKGYLDSVEADVQHLAAITRTPPHYLLGQSGAFPSGESLKATETGLVAKVLEITDSFTESHEEVARIWLAGVKDPRAEDEALSFVWQNPESRSDAEKYDAASKQEAIGVPWRSRMEYLGFTPQQIERMDGERAEDAAMAALAAPAPMLALPPGPPVPTTPTPAPAAPQRVPAGVG